MKEQLMHRCAIMRLRVRGLNTRPEQWQEKHIQHLLEMFATVVKQRDEFVRELNKADAHIKFLEDEIRARGTT